MRKLKVNPTEYEQIKDFLLDILPKLSPYMQNQRTVASFQRNLLEVLGAEPAAGGWKEWGKKVGPTTIEYGGGIKLPEGVYFNPFDILDEIYVSTEETGDNE